MLKKVFILLVAIVTIAMIVFLAERIPYLAKNKLIAHGIEKKQQDKKKRVAKERKVAEEIIRYDLLDPEMAPDDIHDEVMRGYNLLLHTNKLLPEYVNDRLTCSNCHFSAGNTLGGKNGSISLVGVVRTYPRFSERFGKTINLVERINNCFERSMNGRPLPKDSKEMQSILIYLEWISSKIPERKTYPWLGLEPLASTHIPDPARGAHIYKKNCSMCHLINGQGTENNPPVWGPDAFNDGAGMSTLPKMASFIFYNMPYEDPFLTQEQALDVAAYLIDQRRPAYSVYVPD